MFVFMDGVILSMVAVVYSSSGGLPVGEGVLGDFPLRLYYAYGIRNNFGFNFEPVTGNIWDSENGADD